MLPSVDFYSQTVAVNIKINDVVSNVLLTVYGEGQALQEKIPKLSFSVGHVVSQIPGEGDEFFVVVEWHRSSVVVIGLTEQSALLLGDPHPSRLRAELARRTPSPRGRQARGRL